MRIMMVLLLSLIANEVFAQATEPQAAAALASVSQNRSDALTEAEQALCSHSAMQWIKDQLLATAWANNPQAKYWKLEGEKVEKEGDDSFVGGSNLITSGDIGREAMRDAYNIDDFDKVLAGKLPTQTDYNNAWKAFGYAGRRYLVAYGYYQKSLDFVNMPPMMVPPPIPPAPAPIPPPMP